MSNDANKKTGVTNASRSPATATHAVKAAMVAAAVAMTAFWRRRDRSTTSGDNAFPAMNPMLKVGYSSPAAQKMPLCASRNGRTTDTLAICAPTE